MNFININDMQILGVFIAAFGLLLNARQQRKANLQHRIDIVSDILWKIQDDKDICKIYYEIEYGEFIYNANFHSSEDEKRLDKLLSLLGMVAKRYYSKQITKKDLDIIKYEYLVVYQDENVQKYLNMLVLWFKQRGIEHLPYKEFCNLGKILENSN